MCLASKYIDSLQESINQIREGIKKLSIMLSKYDKELSKYYHQIEVGKFNAAQRCKIVEELQLVLQKRRLVKNELYKLQCVRDTLNYSNVQQQINKASKSLHKVITNHNDAYTEGFKVTLDDVLRENEQIIN